MERLESLWLPFTPNRYFKKHPKLLKSARGMYYKDVEGNDILDSCAGLWCVNAGHGQEKITHAIKSQLDTVDFAPTFQAAHPYAFKLANQLIELTPNSLNHVFFANSGSESVDSALKIALHYQAARGKKNKVVLVGREKAYHGVGFGGISVGGLPNNQRHFQLLPHVAHLPHTLDQSLNRFTKGLPKDGDFLSNHLEKITETQGDIAAVIVEPISGSAGVILPPVDYLKKLRTLCDKLDALLIFDEVITGFGRIGDAFAANHFDVCPDMMTTAKGLTNGTIPMGAVIVKDTIYKTITDSAKEKAIELFHGYTYSGHPLACAAASACLDVYQEQGLFKKALTLNNYFEKAVHSLSNIDRVIDVRNYGLMAAIELEPRKNAPMQRGYDVFEYCFNHGLLIRITADTIALSPPLIVEETHIDTMINILTDAINEVR